jgi:hypothetical protein
MTLDESRVEAIAGEIARYLVQHPDAADTFDGITRWWLTRIRFEEATRLVAQALEGLVRDGRVVEQELPDGTLLYRSALQ